MSAHQVFVTLHVIGAVIAVGGVTVTDLIWFLSEKQPALKPLVSVVLPKLSLLIWVGLVVLVFSGLGLYVPHAASYHASAKFLSKMLIVGIVIVNGVILNVWAQPMLKKAEERPEDVQRIKRTRMIATIFGALSVVSWYGALVLGTIETLSMTFWQIIGIYAGAAVVAILVGTALLRYHSPGGGENAEPNP